MEIIDSLAAQRIGAAPDSWNLNVTNSVVTLSVSWTRLPHMDVPVIHPKSNKFVKSVATKRRDKARMEEFLMKRMNNWDSTVNGDIKRQGMSIDNTPVQSIELMQQTESAQQCREAKPFGPMDIVDKLCYATTEIMKGVPQTPSLSSDVNFEAEFNQNNEVDLYTPDFEMPYDVDIVVSIDSGPACAAAELRYKSTDTCDELFEHLKRQFSCYNIDLVHEEQCDNGTSLHELSPHMQFRQFCGRGVKTKVVIKSANFDSDSDSETD